MTKIQKDQLLTEKRKREITSGPFLKIFLKLCKQGETKERAHYNYSKFVESQIQKLESVIKN